MYTNKKLILFLSAVFIATASFACAQRVFIGNIGGYSYTIELSGVEPFSDAKGSITFYSADPGYIQQRATINAQGLRKNILYEVILNEAAKDEWDSPTTRWRGYFNTYSYGTADIIVDAGFKLPHNPYLPKRVFVVMYPNLDQVKYNDLKAHGGLADMTSILVLKSY